MIDFFSIVKIESEQSGFSADIRLNADHEIFEGHFPGSPVVPGVCMIRVVHELLEASGLVKLRLSSADNIKFLAVIDPRRTPDVSVNVDYTLGADLYHVRASIGSGQVTYFKLKGVFTVH